MAKTYLVKTRAGIVEVPDDVIGDRPWHLPRALWTRLVELCTDWARGRPTKPITDMLVPDAMFREMRARIEQFLYKKNPALVEEAVSQRLVPIIDDLHKIDWAKNGEPGRREGG